MPEKVCVQISDAPQSVARVAWLFWTNSTSLGLAPSGEPGLLVTKCSSLWNAVSSIDPPGRGVQVSVPVARQVCWVLVLARVRNVWSLS